MRRYSGLMKQPDKQKRGWTCYVTCPKPRKSKKSKITYWLTSFFDVHSTDRILIKTGEPH